MKRNHTVKKKVLLLAAAFSLLIGNVFIARTYADSGGQVSSWAQKDIEEAQRSNLVPAVLNGRFRLYLTRERFSEAAVLLYSALTGKAPAAPSSKPFKDTGNTRVLQAYELGIVKGTGPALFSPYAMMTREQLALMLYNTLGKAGFGSELTPGGAAPHFTDEGRISPWAREAVRAMMASGFMQGSPAAGGGMRFDPQSKATGEQAIVLVNRIYKRFGTFFVDSEYELLDASESEQTLPVVVREDRSRQVYDKAKAVVAEIIRPGMSDYEKELAIHDYLLLHVAYDYDNYVRDTIPYDSYTMYGALIKGIAVCQGYAYGAQLMLEMAGIESHIVTGTANGIPHAWNKVKIGGQYYNLDVTWDDPVPDVQGRVTYGYFNVTDEELRRDHVWEDNLPKAEATAYNYFNYNGLTVYSRSEFEARVGAAIQKKDPSITLKRAYQDDQKDGGIAAVVAHYPEISGYTYTTDNSSVIVYTFTYR